MTNRNATSVPAASAAGPTTAGTAPQNGAQTPSTGPLPQSALAEALAKNFESQGAEETTSQVQPAGNEGQTELEPTEATEPATETETATEPTGEEIPGQEPEETPTEEVPTEETSATETTTEDAEPIGVKKRIGALLKRIEDLESKLEAATTKGTETTPEKPNQPTTVDAVSESSASDGLLTCRLFVVIMELDDPTPTRSLTCACGPGVFIRAVPRGAECRKDSNQLTKKMPETIKVLKTATTPEGIGVQQQVVKPIVATVGIRADDLSSKDLAKVTELMQKSKKPVEFALSFNGDAISYLVRVAGTKIVLDQMLLSAERDAAKRSKILDKLVSLGAATQAQADAFNKAHPDQDKLDDLKKQIDELRKKIADEQKQLDELTKQYKAAGGK